MFPFGFEKKCENVAKDLSQIQELNLSLKNLKNELKSSVEELRIKQKNALEERHISDWVIKDSKFRDIIDRFTITAHKEAAGKIGGFEIESGADSGNITFF